MTMISFATVSARIAAVPLPHRQPRPANHAEHDRSRGLLPLLAVTPERPPIPGASSWVTALLIAVGLMLLWAWLRLA